MNLPELIRDLCLLRRGPQDLPYSPATLAGLIAVLLLIEAAVAMRVPQVSVLQELLAMVLVLALVHLGLRVAQKGNRFVQTATALVGVRIVFVLLALPLVLYVASLPRDVAQLSGGAAAIVLLGSAVLFAWQLAVRAHVMRHAFDAPMRMGLLLAVVLFAAEVMLLLILAQGAAPTPGAPS